MKTAFMMTYKTWDNILVPFPFTNLQSVKKRPALIVSTDAFNIGPDVVILFITSNISSYGRQGDCLIQNWKEGGLPKPSMTRMKFATIEKSIIIKKIGRLPSNDQAAVSNELKLFFGFE